MQQTNPRSLRRVAFLKVGPFYNPKDLSNYKKLEYLSGSFCGDILTVVNMKEFRNYRVSNFKIRGLYLSRFIWHKPPLRNIFYTLFVLTWAFGQRFRNQQIDFIVTYDPLVTGFLGLLTSRIVKGKLAVEINGNYKAALTLNGINADFLSGLKDTLGFWIIPFVLKKAHGIKLLYKRQLDPFNMDKRSLKVSVYQDFVPISEIHFGHQEGDYFFFLGFPWFLKGVDILIRAFNEISMEFPEVKLKIVGYCPDKSFYYRIAAGNARIEFGDPVPYTEALELMKRCKVFVLPSRTEAMGRVLLEAMAAGKAIVASDVDGIPTYIQDGVNGMLFRGGDSDDLACKLRRVLRDPNLRQQLGGNGHRIVDEQFSEKEYVVQFMKMVENL